MPLERRLGTQTSSLGTESLFTPMRVTLQGKLPKFYYTSFMHCICSLYYLMYALPYSNTVQFIIKDRSLLLFPYFCVMWSLYQSKEPIFFPGTQNKLHTIKICAFRSFMVFTNFYQIDLSILPRTINKFLISHPEIQKMNNWIVSCLFDTTNINA